MKPSKTDLTKFRVDNSKFFALPDSFEDDFQLLYTAPEGQGILNYYKKEYKGRFKNQGNADVTDRVLKHWENLGIIPASRSMERGWRQYGFMDQVWTMIVISLRRFGYSLDSIKKIKDDYFCAFSDQVDSAYPILTLFAVYQSHYKDPIYLAVYDNGQAELSLKKDYLITQAESVPPIVDHIVLNVSSIIKCIDNFFPEKRPETLLNLSDKESKILKAYRSEDVMEIKISKTPKHVNLETTSPVDLATNTIGSSMRNVSFGELIVTRAHGGVSRALLKKTERL